MNEFSIIIIIIIIIIINPYLNSSACSLVPYVVFGAIYSDSSECSKSLQKPHRKQVNRQRSSGRDFLFFIENSFIFLN